MITIFSTKKQKGLKQNGVSGKYSIITRNTWPKFIDKLFVDTNWYYLTIIFNGKGYKVNTILWKDEIDLLKITITLPFKYCIYPVSTINTRSCLEIKLDKVPDIVKDAYDKLSADEFCEYYKRALKGY